MKHLYETFTDEEWETLIKAKSIFTWHKFLLAMAEQINLDEQYLKTAKEQVLKEQNLTKEAFYDLDEVKRLELRIKVADRVHQLEIAHLTERYCAHDSR